MSTAPVKSIVSRGAGAHKYAEPDCLHQSAAVSQPWTERESEMYQYIMALRKAIAYNRINLNESTDLAVCDSCDLHYSTLDLLSSGCDICNTNYCRECSLEYGTCKYCEKCNEYFCADCISECKCTTTTF